MAARCPGVVVLPAGENWPRQTSSTTVSTRFDGTTSWPSMTACAWLLMIVPAGVGAAIAVPNMSKPAMRANDQPKLLPLSATPRAPWRLPAGRSPVRFAHERHNCWTGKFVSPSSLDVRGGPWRSSRKRGRHGSRSLDLRDQLDAEVTGYGQGVGRVDVAIEVAVDGHVDRLAGL